MEEKKFKLAGIIFPLVVIIIFLAAFITVLNIYKKEGEKRSVFIENPTSNPDHINIFANIVSIDAAKGEMTVRISFEPKGKLANETFFLNEDIEFYVNSSVGKQEYSFAKNKIMNPVDVTLNLFDGLVTDYPLDKHEAELIINTAGKIIKTDSSQEEEYAKVNNVLNFTGSITGYKIDAEQDKSSNESYTLLSISIERSASVKFFSFFVICTMWALIIVLLALLYNVLFNNRKIEVNMFTFTSSMLFAFPAFRNMMPFAPPIGAYPDYIAFFWAEAAAALTLVALIITWIRRKQ